MHARPQPKLVPWHKIHEMTDCQNCVANYIRVRGRLDTVVTIYRGSVYASSDGDRLVLMPGTIIIYQNLRTFEAYAQHSQEFITDVGMDVLDAYRKGVVRGEGAVVFAYFSLRLASTLAGAGALVKLGEVLAWLHEEKKKGFPTQAKIVAVLAARKFLKTHAPKLWDLIWYAVLKDIGGQALNPDSYSAEDLVMLLADLCMKSGGYRQLASKLQKVLTTLNIVSTTLVAISKAGVKGAIREYQEDANAWLVQLRQAGIVANLVDIPRLKMELLVIQNHLAEFNEIVRKLNQAYMK